MPWEFSCSFNSFSLQVKQVSELCVCSNRSKNNLFEYSLDEFVIGLKRRLLSGSYLNSRGQQTN